MIQSSSVDVADPPTTSFAPSSGILRRKGSSPSSLGLQRRRITPSSTTDATSAPVTDHPTSPPSSIVGQRKRSILKHDSFDEASSVSNRLRGVLKKDSSYDDPLRPILKNNADPHESAPPRTAPTHSSSSSEDIAVRSNQFNDVVIDPIPGQGRKDSTATTSATTATTSLSVAKVKDREEHVTSVNISSDDKNLANKLEQITVEAEYLKKSRMQKREEEEEAASAVKAELSDNSGNRASGPG
jgi:hypothetical protein